MWERIWSNKLGREITVVLIAKLILLILIWWVFFSDPIDRYLDHRGVAKQFFKSKPPTPSTNKEESQ